MVQFDTVSLDIALMLALILSSWVCLWKKLQKSQTVQSPDGCLKWSWLSQRHTGWIEVIRVHKKYSRILQTFSEGNSTFQEHFHQPLIPECTNRDMSIIHGNVKLQIKMKHSQINIKYGHVAQQLGLK